MIGIFLKVYIERRRKKERDRSMNGNDLKKRFKQLVTWSVLIALVLCHNPQTMKTVLAIESETL